MGKNNILQMKILEMLEMSKIMMPLEKKMPIFCENALSFLPRKRVLCASNLTEVAYKWIKYEQFGKAHWKNDKTFTI